jgi:hypothetical protein
VHCSVNCSEKRSEGWWRLQHPRHAGRGAGLGGRERRGLRTCSASVLGGSWPPGRRSSALHCLTARSTLAAQIQASVAA